MEIPVGMGGIFGLPGFLEARKFFGSYEIFCSQEILVNFLSDLIFLIKFF